MINHIFFAQNITLRSVESSLFADNEIEYLSNVQTVYLNETYYTIGSFNYDQTYITKLDKDLNTLWSHYFFSGQVSNAPKELVVMDDLSTWISMEIDSSENVFLVNLDSKGQIIQQKMIKSSGFASMLKRKDNTFTCFFDSWDYSNNTNRRAIEFWTFDHKGKLLSKKYLKGSLEQIFNRAIITKENDIILYGNGRELTENSLLRSSKTITKINSNLTVNWSKFILDTSTVGNLLLWPAITSYEKNTYILERNRNVLTLYKLDQNGELVWHNLIGNASNYYITHYSLSVSNGFIYLVFFEPPGLRYFPVISQFDTDGNYINSKRFENNLGKTSYQTTSGFALLTGHEEKTILAIIKKTIENSNSNVIDTRNSYNEILDIAEVCQTINYSFLQLKAPPETVNTSTLQVRNSSTNFPIYDVQLFSIAKHDNASSILFCKKTFSLNVNDSYLRICNGERAILQAYGASKYNWTIQGQNESIGRESSLSVTPTTTTTYQVEGDVYMKKSVTVEVATPSECMAENLKPTELITPNGDGINDDFIIENIEFFPKNFIRVWNKWGQMVAYKEGFQNGDILLADLPEGAYFYQLEIPESKHTIKRTLYITR